MLLISIVTSIVVLCEALLALVVYVHNPKEKGNRFFTLFVLTIIVWTISNLLTNLFASPICSNITFIAGILLFYTLFLFVEVFPTTSFLLPSWLEYIVHCVTVFLTLLIILPGGIVVNGINLASPGLDVITGPLFFLVPIYYVGVFGLSIFVLGKKFVRSKNVERVQLEYMIWGLFISALLGLGSSVFIPLLTGSYVSSQYGPFSIIFLLLFTVVAIVRYNLLNITVIATETFAVLLVLILLIQVFIADTPLQFVGGLTVLFLAIVLSFFLIRSMLREVRQKEELAKLSDLLETTNQQLKALDETKSEFVSIASHQLRTPLTVIKGYLSMILEGSFGKIPEKQVGPLDKTYESANRLIELVENLLSVSRIESGRMKYNLVPTQLADVAASVVDEIASKAKEKKLHLQYDAPREALPVINIDSDKIRQVMMNLVDNAVKYTKKGSVNVTVRMMSGQAGGHVDAPSVVFEVKDTGNGVRADDKDRLFQKFIRGQGSSLVHTEGTGLGLYVGRMMVEAHGGHIWVDSKGEGLGSTFAFSLPLSIPKTAPALTSGSASAPAVSAPGAASSTS